MEAPEGLVSVRPARAMANEAYLTTVWRDYQTYH